MPLILFPHYRTVQEVRAQMHAARERDSAAAWYCLRDQDRERLCAMAGVPKAAGKGHGELTPKDRAAIVIALQEKEVRQFIHEQIRWGLDQLAEIPADYLPGSVA